MFYFFNSSDPVMPHGVQSHVYLNHKIPYSWSLKPNCLIQHPHFYLVTTIGQRQHCQGNYQKIGYILWWSCWVIDRSDYQQCSPVKLGLKIDLNTSWCFSNMLRAADLAAKHIHQMGCAVIDWHSCIVKDGPVTDTACDHIYCLVY